MDAKSQLLLRNPAHFEGKVLLAGLPADDLLKALPRAFGWSWQMDAYMPLARWTDGRCHFDIEPPPTEFAAAVLFLPKSREQTDYLLTHLAACLVGKPLYLVGEKRAGIERAARQLQAFGTPHKIDSARHCQLWRVWVEQPAQKPQLADWLKSYQVPLADGTLEVISLPGVFAHGHLDAGTALLLEHLDALPRGSLLDFGCGAGVLGAALARRYPNQSVTLLDSCAFALYSAHLTLAANDVEAKVQAACGIADAKQDFAAIISNPPFHQGIATCYQTTEDLLREARNHLAAQGELRIVANRFLKYPPLLAQYPGGCETLAERDGFHVLRAANQRAK